jgi:hypothetical protein
MWIRNRSISVFGTTEESGLLKLHLKRTSMIERSGVRRA